MDFGSGLFSAALCGASGKRKIRIKRKGWEDETCGMDLLKQQRRQ